MAMGLGTDTSKANISPPAPRQFKHAKLFWIFLFKIIIKFLIGPYIAVSRHALNQNGKLHGALYTLDVNFFHKIYPFEFQFCTENC